MAENIMMFFYNVFEACSGWFTAIMQNTNMVSVYIGLSLMAISTRFLLAPVFGAGNIRLGSTGSDMADMSSKGARNYHDDLGKSDSASGKR